MIRCPLRGTPVKIQVMSDSNLAPARGGKPVKSRSKAIKPGHLEVGEFTSSHIGASSPFGSSAFPLPVRSIYYEHPEHVETRILEDERR